MRGSQLLNVIILNRVLTVLKQPCQIGLNIKQIKVDPLLIGKIVNMKPAFGQVQNYRTIVFGRDRATLYPLKPQAQALLNPIYTTVYKLPNKKNR